MTQQEVKVPGRCLAEEHDMSYLKNLEEAAGAEYEVWYRLNDIVRSAEGAIPWKYRELIALAVAETTQCVYCIRAHAEAARRAGATQNEVAESAFIAAALRAGGAVAHGALAMRFFEEAGSPDRNAGV